MYDYNWCQTNRQSRILVIGKSDKIPDPQISLHLIAPLFFASHLNSDVLVSVQFCHFNIIIKRQSFQYANIFPLYVRIGSISQKR